MTVVTEAAAWHIAVEPDPWRNDNHDDEPPF